VGFVYQEISWFLNTRKGQQVHVYFSSGAETTPDSIPANSVVSFLFLFGCHVFLVTGRRRAQPEPLGLRTLPDGLCVSTSPLEEMDLRLLGCHGSKTDGAEFMPVNTFSLRSCVILKCHINAVSDRSCLGEFHAKCLDLC